MTTREVTSPTAVLDAVRAAAAGPIAARASEVDRRRAFPRDSIEALFGCDAHLLFLPGELDGAGGGLRTLADACEAVGGACASTGMVFLMHSVAAATIGAAGGPGAARAAEAIAATGALATLAFSEHATGAHFHSPEIEATRRAGTVEASGRKSFVTSAGHADLYLVLVGDPVAGESTCYLVERDDPGVSFDGSWEGLGMSGNASVAMLLESVALDDGRMVGEAGGGEAIVFDIVAPRFLVGLAAVNVGIAAAAKDVATDHAAQRRYADGSVLAEVQSIQHLLADADIAVRSARAVLHEAAERGDAGDREALLAIMEAKVLATQTAARVADLALEVCGGQAYGRSLPIERHLRDSRAGAVMAPTNGVLRNWIGRSLAGLPVP